MLADKILFKAQLDDHVKLAQRRRSSYYPRTESMRLQLIDIILEVKREQPGKRTAWEQVIARLAQLPPGSGFEMIILATDHHCFGHHRIVKYFQSLLSKYRAAMLRTGGTIASISPCLTEAICKKLGEYEDLLDLEIDISKQQKLKKEDLFPTLGPNHTCSPERILRSSNKQSAPATRHLSKAQLDDHVNTVQHHRCKWTEPMRLKLIDTMIKVRREQPRSTVNIWEQLITRLWVLPASHGFKIILKTAHKGERMNFGSHRVATQFRSLMGRYNRALMWRKDCTRASFSNPLTESVCRKLQEYSDLINEETDSITSSASKRSRQNTARISTSLKISKKFKSASDDDPYINTQDGSSSKQPECHDDDQTASVTPFNSRDADDDSYINTQDGNSSKQPECYDDKQSASVTPFNSRQNEVLRSTSSYSQRADDSNPRATQNIGSASSDPDIAEGFEQNRLKESLLEGVYEEFSQPSCKCKHELLSMGIIQFLNKAAEEGLHDKRRKGLTDPYKKLEAYYSFQLFQSKLRAKHLDLEARHQDLEHKAVRECQKTTLEISGDFLEALHL